MTRETINYQQNHKAEKFWNAETQSVHNELNNLKTETIKLSESNETQDPPNLKEWFALSELKKFFVINENFSNAIGEKENIFLEPLDHNILYNVNITKTDSQTIYIRIEKTMYVTGELLGVDLILKCSNTHNIDTKFLQIKDQIETINDGQQKIINRYLDERFEFKEPYCHIKYDERNWKTQQSIDPIIFTQTIYSLGKKFATIGYDTKEKKFFTEVNKEIKLDENIENIMSYIDTRHQETDDYKSIENNETKVTKTQNEIQTTIENIYDYEMSLDFNQDDDIYQTGTNELSLNMTLWDDRIINKPNGEVQSMKYEYWLRSSVVFERGNDPIYKIESCDGLDNSIFQNLAGVRKMERDLLENESVDEINLSRFRSTTMNVEFVI